MTHVSAERATARRTLLAIGETMAMVAPVRAEPVTEAEEFLIDAGGAESNVAAHVAALGHDALWFSRLGADALGWRVARQLAARGIDVSRVIYDDAHPTGLYVKDPGQGVSYYRRGSAASHLSASDADEVDLLGVDVLHVSGITAAISASASAFLSRIMTRASEAGVLVSFDVNHRSLLWPAADAAPVLAGLARRADIVFTGRDEAEALWDTPNASDIRALFRGVPELVVKDGAVGATVFVGDVVAFAPSQKVDVIEAVGAGDAFAGGYLARRLSDAPLVERLRTGHHRAARTLQTTKDSIDEARAT
ncbi:sugar kinase [Microbacterium sp. P5_E9]